MLSASTCSARLSLASKERMMLVVVLRMRPTSCGSQFFNLVSRVCWARVWEYP